MLNTSGSCVLVATPGMLHAGASLDAFRFWASDSRNLVLFTSHCIRGTLGHRLLQGATSVNVCARAPDASIKVSNTLSVTCAVRQHSFSAHADAKGLLSLMRRSCPRTVVLVHGERRKMANLRMRVMAYLANRAMLRKMVRDCSSLHSMFLPPTASRASKQAQNMKRKRTSREIPLTTPRSREGSWEKLRQLKLVRLARVATRFQSTRPVARCPACSSSNSLLSMFVRTRCAVVLPFRGPTTYPAVSKFCLVMHWQPTASRSTCVYCSRYRLVIVCRVHLR